MPSWNLFLPPQTQRYFNFISQKYSTSFVFTDSRKKEYERNAETSEFRSVSLFDCCDTKNSIKGNRSQNKKVKTSAHNRR